MLDPRTHEPTNSFRLSDGTRHRTHSYYDTWEATNSVLWPSKQPEFATESKEDDDSGICSPPLWTASPPTSPQHRGNHYRSLSPASRTQAIVRGQRELMEMVKNMPESSYELSLKDLVEHQRVDARYEKTTEERTFRWEGAGGAGGGSGRKVGDKIAQVKRSGGKVDHGGGFYLKMVFPFSLGSKDKKNKMKMKNKKKDSLVNGGSKVSPRPSASDGSVKGGGGVDKEWWKKSPSASRESDSGASSINSGSMKSSGSSSSSNNSSSRRSNSRHEKSGGRWRCWPFIRRLKIQTNK